MPFQSEICLIIWIWDWRSSKSLYCLFVVPSCTLFR